MTLAQEVGERLSQLQREKAAMERRDILNGEVAGAVGVTEEAYSRYRGGKRIPKPEVLQALADYFGVTREFLHYGAGAGGKPQGMPQPDPTRDRLITEEEIERARQSVVRKSAKKTGAHRKRRGA